MSQQIHESPIIRLACLTCDRGDYDGASMDQAIDDGWLDIDEADITDERCWWTHLGECPYCQQHAEREYSLARLHT